MSLYADYLKERTHDQIIETDKGFATYRFIDPSTVYIVDIYVSPDFRHSREASHMADAICEIAKSKGCTKVIGSVVPSTRGSTTSLKVLLGYGMTLQSSTNDFIVFERSI
jgi:ribosomal protein S18 acetylase RimI-like enzyme